MFLIGLAGTAATFAFAPEKAAAIDSAPFEPTIWYSVDRDGIVTVNIARAEMGQHIGTAIARILADELEVEWSNVRISMVDTDPKWGVMVTGGSKSVWLDFPVYSRAGAAGRIALIEAGAKLLGVSPPQCVARQGAVFAANRSVSYGEIISRGEPARKFTPDELAKLPIKPVSNRRLIGKKADALDIPAKVNGTARYGIDAAVPGMVYARPKIPPTRYGSVVRSVDDSIAKRIKGYLTWCLRIPPTRYRVGSSCARRPTRRPSVPPILSRSTGLRAMPRRCRSETSSTTAQGRSPRHRGERLWLTTPRSIRPFAQPPPRSSGHTRLGAYFMPSSSP
jgi:hypothetical protein